MDIRKQIEEMIGEATIQLTATPKGTVIKIDGEIINKLVALVESEKKKTADKIISLTDDLQRT